MLIACRRQRKNWRSKAVQRVGEGGNSHVVAIEVVGVSSSGKAAGRERVLGLGGVVHADYHTAAAAQVQHCLRSAA